MAYIPNPTDVTQPVESVFAQTAAAEFRALKAYIQTIVSSGGPGAIAPGAFQFFQLLTPPPGWIVGDGSTIGAIGSGATSEGPQNQALFTAWWAYTDVQLPILTSAGAASTRGASAAADWAANKRLTVFDVRDRFVRGASATNINGDTQGDAIRNITGSTGTVYRAAAGGASGAISLTAFGSTPAKGGVAGVDSGDNVNIAFNASLQVPTASENRPVNIAMLPCYKL